MRANIFHKETGFQPYQTPSDSKYLVIAWSGLVTESLRLHASTHEPNRINYVARMYYYISGMLKVISARFDVEQYPTHSPSFWYDLALIEEAIAELSDMFNRWFCGEDFQEACLLYNTDKILMSLANLCLIFKIRPTLVLDIAKRSIKEDLRQIPEPKMRYPAMHIRKQGPISKKGDPFINLKDKYWNYVKNSQHATQAEYGLRKTYCPTVEDKRWLECFHGIFEDMKK